MIKGLHALYPRLAVSIALATAWVVRLEAEDTNSRLQSLAEQNRHLAEEVSAQDKTIRDLTTKMSEMEKLAEQQAQQLESLRAKVDGAGENAAPIADRDHEVRISAEAGLAFFNTGHDGQFPHAEFRVDDPVISFEAPVWKDVFVFSELKLLTREASNENFQLGEFYADFENVSGAWGQPDLLSFRAGRVNTPFGEEYQVRGPVENPLITHSLSDIWGTDEGAEIYGRVGQVRYVLAVQNGGVSRLHDYNADKAIVGRLGWEPTAWLHLSGSAMRTGILTTGGDQLSDLWFANGFFRALGSPSTTTKFWADLAEVDARVHWTDGHLSAAYGLVYFDDNDRAKDNSRRLHYGYLELVQSLTDRLYAAGRYSEVRAPRGYPLAGEGNVGEYFFQPLLTETLHRLSLGFGYRLGPPVVLKMEYSWESGRLSNGAMRNGEDFFGSEIGVKF